MGLLETRLATLSDCVEASQRPFAWAPFPARAAKPEPLEPEWGTCAWPPSRIDAYSSLIPATRRESSRTYRKYEVPNHVVTQNDWQPPRRVENPRPKSGRSPVRSRPWPQSITAVQQLILVRVPVRRRTGRRSLCAVPLSVISSISQSRATRCTHHVPTRLTQCPAR
jgi:hypothetical protein